MKIYLVDGMVVQQIYKGNVSLQNKDFLGKLVSWVQFRPGTRRVHCHSGATWYLLGYNKLWRKIPDKPKPIAMAELCDSIIEVKVKEVKNEVPTSSLFR